jgi:hypothetical protein
LNDRGAAVIGIGPDDQLLRLASSVRLGVRQLASGAFVWQAVWLPSRFLPDGCELLVEQIDPREPPRPLGRVALPEVLSPALSGFFDWLRRLELGERALGSPVLVTLVKPHEAGGRKGYFVREPDDPTGPLGLLIDGTAPDPLPEAGATVTAYLYNLDPRSPRYRWDRIPPPPERPARRRSEDQRSRS